MGSSDSGRSRPGLSRDWRPDRGHSQIPHDRRSAFMHFLPTHYRQRDGQIEDQQLMGDILLETQGVPSTPSAGQAVVFVENQAESLVVKDEAGRVKGSGQNAAVAQQSVATSDTYITNSDLQLPAGGMQVGMVLEWEIF